jgi:serine/threonine protein kinase
LVLPNALRNKNDLLSEQFRDINVGSPIYMSPEGLLQSTYGPKSDVWALGVLLFEMLHGDPPMGFCNSESELKMHINKPINPKAFKPTIPHDLRDLIIKCLEVDYRKRISMQDIQFHPYIQRVSKELGRNLHTMSPLQNKSPALLIQPQTPSVYSTGNIINSTFVNDNLQSKLNIFTQSANQNLKSKLNIFTQASGITTTTSSSEMGMINFDEGL